jgi:hypothetical protein
MRDETIRGLQTYILVNVHVPKISGIFSATIQQAGYCCTKCGSAVPAAVRYPRESAKAQTLTSRLMLNNIKSATRAAKDAAVKHASATSRVAKSTLKATKTSAVEQATMVKEVAKSAMRARELPILVERLQAGHAVYSQSFISDTWLVLKNSHLIFSLFFAHPKHPFSACERRICLSCSLALGFGITCLIALMNDSVTGGTLIAVTVLLGGLLQGVYDALLRIFATCSCVQRCPTPIRVAFECCGSIGLVFQFVFGAIICVSGVLSLKALYGDDEVSTATWQFFASKFQAWFVSSIALSVLSFWMRRRKQVRPTDSQAYEEWNKIPDGARGVLCLTGAKTPQSFLWNKYIGEDKTMEHLPLRAPRYAYTLCCMQFGEDEPFDADLARTGPTDVEVGHEVCDQSPDDSNNEA